MLTSINFRQIAAVLLLSHASMAFAAGTWACDGAKSIEQTFRAFGERVEQMTIVQKGLASAAEAALDQAALAHGWPVSRRREVIDAFLGSAEYRAGEHEKAPLLAKTTEYQAAIRVIKTAEQGEAMCKRAPEILQAIEARFEINKRQYELLLRRIRDAQ